EKLGSSGVRKLELGDELVFPAALRAKRQAQLARTLVEKMAIHLPGVADAAMRLRALLGGVVEGLRRGDARCGCRKRQFARIRRQGPGAEIRVRPRQLRVH